MEGLDLKVYPDEEEVPGDTEYLPNGVEDGVTWSPVVDTEHANQGKDGGEEVEEDGPPHLTQEVKDLSLDGGEKLQETDGQEEPSAGTSTASTAHSFNGYGLEILGQRELLHRLHPKLTNGFRNKVEVGFVGTEQDQETKNFL